MVCPITQGDHNKSNGYFKIQMITIKLLIKTNIFPKWPEMALCFTVKLLALPVANFCATELPVMSSKYINDIL